MDAGRAALVVGLMLVLVIFINVAIYALVTRNSRTRSQEAEVMRKVLNQAVRPLHNDDRDYNELSQRVSALKQAQALTREDHGKGVPDDE